MTSLCFKIEGEFLTNHFRKLVLDGDSNKAIVGLMDSLVGLDIETARDILKGKKKLIGTNDLELVDDVGMSEDYMIDLCYVYRKQREVESIWTSAELEEYMKQVPVEPDYPSKTEIIYDMLDAATRDGKRFETCKSGRLYLMTGGVGPPMPSRAQDIKDVQMRHNREMLNKFLRDVDGEFEFKANEYSDEYDWDHYTWIVSPAGNFYKVPFQSHDEWIDRFRGNLEQYEGMHFHDDYHVEDSPVDYISQGWVRLSGGPMIGLTIRFDSSTDFSRRGLFSILSKYSYMTDMTIDIVNKEDHSLSKFEAGIDFKKVRRYINGLV